jgi:VCBS repeat-containing protein
VRLIPRRAAALGLAVAMAALTAPVVSAGVPTAPPTVAQDDSYLTDEDVPIEVAAPEGVLANDPPGACVISISATATMGTVTMDADGAFTYTPPANFNGQTAFLYEISNAGPCEPDQVTDSEAVVTITVNPVNDAPTAAADSFQVLKDRTLNVGVPGVLLNDHDVDDDSLTAVKVTNPTHGVVTLAADGSFSYTPATGYTGPDAFSYRASDGTDASPTRVVSLTVTAVPVVPTPTPVPTPTAAPTPTPEITAEPSPSVEPSPSGEPSPSPADTASPSPGASATPAPTPVPGETTDGGGISLPVLLVILLLVLLLGFGAALYGPRWLAAQRGEPIDDEDGP